MARTKTQPVETADLPALNSEVLTANPRRQRVDQPVHQRLVRGC